MSNDTGNRYAPIVEAVYLTTRVKHPLPTHVYIGSALRPSTALCEQIVTVCKDRLENYMGRVTDAELEQIDRALNESLGLKGTGGTSLNISMKTPFGEMSFDVTPEQATDLMQRAFRYAAEKSTPPAAIPTTDTAPAKQEDTPPPATAKKPMSRVERMFGDFKNKTETTDLSGAPPETKVQILENAERLGQRFNGEGYTGFLLLECPHCGKIHGFCAKKPITEYTCPCGGSSEIKDLIPAYLECKCGKRFKYRTNITRQRFDYTCVNCGSPVDMELNARRTAYVTIK